MSTFRPHHDVKVLVDYCNEMEEQLSLDARSSCLHKEEIDSHGTKDERRPHGWSTDPKEPVCQPHLERMCESCHERIVHDGIFLALRISSFYVVTRHWRS